MYVAYENFLFILLLMTRVLSHVEIIDPDSFDWMVKNGEKWPILRIVVNGETILLPLREAPFCRLADTRECECFILRKDNDSSDWEVASFVKCGHEVRGNFLSTKYQFGIAPKSGSKTGKHIVEKYEPEDDPTETSAKVLLDEKQEKVTAKNAELSYGFLKPLPEYGELFKNETGYMTVKFVLSKLFLNRTLDIDQTLQNYINNANEYLMDLNLLAIYEGWTQALEPETNLTIDAIHAFHRERYENYDKENTVNVVILFGEHEWLLGTTSEDGFCSGPSGIFVNILPVIESIYGIEILWRFLFGIGFNMGLSPINRTVCDPGEGHRWIMDREPKVLTARMKWSDCSKEAMQKRVKKHLACLKRKIEPKKPRCGNGWVDDGEQCDCITGGCRSCCDSNCKLTKGSRCYNGPCCDKLTCMFKYSGTQCRAADDSCDIPELCDGRSSECPPDFVVSNGYECQESPQRSYCFRGKCGSRSDMCEWTFRNGSVASDSCYKLNTENGKYYGGCGPTFQRYGSNMSNYACKASDMYCGKIFCHVEGAFEPTAKSKRYFARSTLKELSLIEGDEKCFFLQLDKYYRFLQEDPTFVPNGSECAPDHMCVKQRCTPLPEGCPQNCSGVPRIHPYTKQVFPAHEIDWQPRPRESGPSSIIWLYFLVGSLILMSIIGGLYYIYPEYSKTLPEASTDHTSRFTVPSESIDTTVRTLSEPLQSQRLSDDN